MSYKGELANFLDNKGFSLSPNIHNAVLKLEPTNICNHKCKFCPNVYSNRKGSIIESAFAKRIIEEAAKLEIKKMMFTLNGEPLICKELSEYVRYAKKCGIEYVFITTNGSLLTKDRLKDLVDAGIDSIKFSINAGSQKTYKEVHGCDDFEVVIQNLKYAREYRNSLPEEKQFRILSGFVITDLTKDEVEMHFKNISPYVDDLIFNTASNFAGYMSEDCTEIQHYDIDDIKGIVPKYEFFNTEIPCSHLCNSINISCEGFLTLCCMDMDNYLAVVDLNKTTVKEAWLSPVMQDIRKRHMDNQLKHTQCFNCANNQSEAIEPLNKELFYASQKR